ncbi:MAG: hypothetical protein ABMB14_33590, partial [Myxococcota bacterium]
MSDAVAVVGRAGAGASGAGATGTDAAGPPIAVDPPPGDAGDAASDADVDDGPVTTDVVGRADGAASEPGERGGVGA